MAELKIKISADVANGLQGLSAVEIRGEQLRRNIEKLQNVIANTTSQRKLESALKALSQQQAAYNKTVQAAPAALNGLKNSANAANNVLINTGRIFQDLPFGIIGIANNINPLIESFQRASSAAKETGTSLGKTLVQSLAGGGGLGLAFSLVTGAASLATLGLSAFTRGMGSSKDGADEASNAYKDLSESLERVKKSAEDAENQLQFLNRIGKINVDIRGGGALTDLLEQSLAQQQFSSQLRDKQAFLFKQNLDLFNKTNDELGISQAERLKLNTEFGEKIFDIGQKINSSAQTQSLIYRQIQLQKNEDAKALEEKRKQEFEDFVNRTIAAAKELEKQFGDIQVFPELEVDFNTTKNEVFKNALKVLSDFPAFRIPLKIAPVIDTLERPVEIKKVKIEVDEFDLIEAPDFSKEVKEGFEKAQSRLKGLKPFDISNLFTGFNEASEKTKKTLEEQINAARLINETLTPAFNGLFQSIFEGGNALDSFFDGLKSGIQQLITKLDQAAAFAGILSAITGGATGGVGSFFSVFKNILGFAEGGNPPVGRASLVGERGPELFIPSVAGTIIPNHRLSSVAPASGFGGGEVVFRIGGNELIGVLTRTNQSQRRTS